ncbi:hypothetical protein Vretimale_8729 [Volvox reticuliferus]|uniref:Uncharacterized protein n=1 Tax=Volvox reticuliferus TaxID=1737510 RepID=A0A8J4LPM2_9CHLO|nr:hypothetical protein Vretifemale_6273 [Volvox reticuliferus]GIM04104.1 hypothetical protein Vretimale_8729 [Volvox reticuliferus]
MARLYQALVRLRNAGLQGILREAFQLPASFAQPVSKLAAVLRLPPALLWAALTALLGSTVLALSWILTALILTVTQPRDVYEERTNKLHEDIPDEGAGRYLLLRQGGQKPATAFIRSPSSFDGDPGSFSSGPLDDGTDGVYEADGAPEDNTISTNVRRGPADVVVVGNSSHASAWLGPLTPGAVSEEPSGAPYLPYLDEQEAAEVRQRASRCASVIPATAFEAARCCEAVFGLGLDASGYSRLLLSEAAVAAQEEQEINHVGGEGAATLPAEGAAALGRLALHAHLGRYLYGFHSGLPGVSDVEAVAVDDTTAGGRTREILPQLRQQSVAVPLTGAAAAAAAAAAEATLCDLAAFARPEVLAGLARRLRLDLLRREPQRPGSAAASASRVNSKGKCNKNGSPGEQSLRRVADAAAARVGSGAASADPPSTTALAAALLRLVWEAHVVAPGRAWLAVCVLAVLARELRLVGREGVE